MAQRAAQRGKGDARVAARGLHQRVAFVQQAARVGRAKYLQRHTVLDGAGQVQVFGLGIDGALAPAKTVADGKQRRVADGFTERG